MLNEPTRKRIVEVTSALWDEVVSTDYFRDLASGKEVGHRIADFVEEQTVRTLDEQFVTAHQRKAGGSRVDRGMGDVWISSMGVFNPVNVKSGEIDKAGQPNMVSLKKLLRALLKRQIDSYYLLIVKFDSSAWIAHIYLVDLLDVLAFTHFDSGPGQIMLKERLFYEAIEAGWQPAHEPLDSRVSDLYEMLEEADERLARNRARTRDLILRELQRFDVSSPIDQSELRLQ